MISIQIALLLLVVLVTLGMDGSNLGIEPAKVLFFWTLSLPALVTLKRSIQTLLHNNERPKLAKNILFLLLILAFSMLTSTLFAIDHPLAVWGSAQRGQSGPIEILYCLMPLSFMACLASSQFRNRLYWVLLGTAATVSIYAIAQSLGIDPLTWQYLAPGRPGSTLGNPVFLGGWLATILPIQFWIVALLFKPPFSRFAVVLSLLSISLSITALNLSQTRAAWLGLGLASLVLIPLISSKHGRVIRSSRSFKTLVVGVVIFTLIALPFALHRIKHDLGSIQARTLLWQAAESGIADTPQLTTLQESSKLPSWRFWIGYGPDHQTLILEHSRPAALNFIESQGDERSPDRAHNQFLDAWLSGGLLRTLTQLALFVACIAACLSGLNILRSKSHFFTFFISLLLCALTCALTPLIIPSLLPFAWWPALFGLGLVTGIALFVFIQRLRGKVLGIDSTQQWLFVALLAAFIVQFVNNLFSFSLTAGNVLHSALIGLLLWALTQKNRAIDFQSSYRVAALWSVLIPGGVLCFTLLAAVYAWPLWILLLAAAPAIVFFGFTVAITKQSPGRKIAASIALTCIMGVGYIFVSPQLIDILSILPSWQAPVRAAILFDEANYTFQKALIPGSSAAQRQNALDQTYTLFKEAYKLQPFDGELSLAIAQVCVAQTNEKINKKINNFTANNEIIHYPDVRHIPVVLPDPEFHRGDDTSSDELNPKSLNIQSLLSKNCLEYAQHALAALPQRPRAYAVNAALQLSLGHWEAALTDYLDALKLTPLQRLETGFLEQAISVLVAIGDQAEVEYKPAIAETSYRQVLALIDELQQRQTNTIQILRSHAYVLAKLGRLEEAIAQYLQALQEEPNDVAVRRNTIRLMLATPHPCRAYSILTQAPDQTAALDLDGETIQLLNKNCGFISK